MTDAELMLKVKAGLGIVTSANDDNIKIKMLAVKSYLLNAGIPLEAVESDLGIATITIGVNDLWNLNSGDVKFSNAFNLLIAHLQIVNNPEVTTDV